jgi:hypothetical protein
VKVLKFSVITPANVSKQLDCSRTTLYNHGQLLKRYIEFSTARLTECNPPLAMDNIVETRRTLETQVRQMEFRDIKNEQTGPWSNTAWLSLQKLKIYWSALRVSLVNSIKLFIRLHSFIQLKF